MENNVALSLRELADKANEEKKQKQNTQHQEFVNDKIIPLLKERASKGKYYDDVEVADYDPTLIAKILGELGFGVSQYKSNLCLLRVEW